MPDTFSNSISIRIIIDILDSLLLSLHFHPSSPHLLAFFFFPIFVPFNIKFMPFNHLLIPNNHLSLRHNVIFLLHIHTFTYTLMWLILIVWVSVFVCSCEPVDARTHARTSRANNFILMNNIAISSENLISLMRKFLSWNINVCARVKRIQNVSNRLNVFSILRALVRYALFLSWVELSWLSIPILGNIISFALLIWTPNF